MSGTFRLDKPFVRMRRLSAFFETPRDSVNHVADDKEEAKSALPSSIPPSGTPNATLWHEVKAEKNDLMVFLVSDKNPLFHEGGYEAEMYYANYVGFKSVIETPAGTANRHTLEFEMELKSETTVEVTIEVKEAPEEKIATEVKIEVAGTPIDKKKALADGRKKEIQNTHRIAGTTNKFPFLKLIRWGTESEPDNTPKPSSPPQKSLLRRLQQQTDGITGELEQKYVPYSKIQTPECSFLHVPQSVCNRVDPGLKKKLDNIKSIQTTQTKTGSPKHKEDVTRQNPTFFASYLHDGDQKDDELQMVIIPWRTLVNIDPSQNAHPSYEKARRKFCGLILQQKYHDLFEKMVTKVTEIRLDHFFDAHFKNKSPIDKQTWIKDNLERAKPYVDAYLSEEIPFFMMLMDEAPVRFKATGGKTYLAYPMGSPLGECVFTFAAEMNGITLAGTDHFKFVDTTSLMQLAFEQAELMQQTFEQTNLMQQAFEQANILKELGQTELMLESFEEIKLIQEKLQQITDRTVDIQKFIKEQCAQHAKPQEVSQQNDNPTTPLSRKSSNADMATHSHRGSSTSPPPSGTDPMDIVSARSNSASPPPPPSDTDDSNPSRSPSTSSRSIREFTM